METLLLVCVGALVGFRAHRRFKRPLYSKLDCALVGALTTLLLVTVLEIAGNPVPGGLVYFILGYVGVVCWRPLISNSRIITSDIGRTHLTG